MLQYQPFFGASSLFYHPPCCNHHPEHCTCGHCIFHDMDQELEAVMNSGPRLVTPKTWAILIDFAHSSPTPVTTDFVEYVFDVCMLYSLLPSVPYAVVLLLHHLHGISPLKGWMV